MLGGATLLRAAGVEELVFAAAADGVSGAASFRSDMERDPLEEEAPQDAVDANHRERGSPKDSDLHGRSARRACVAVAGRARIVPVLK